jgi:hypothetical protein
LKVTNELSVQLILRPEDLTYGKRLAVFLEIKNLLQKTVTLSNAPIIIASVHNSSLRPLLSMGIVGNGAKPVHAFISIPPKSSYTVRIDDQSAGVMSTNNASISLALGGAIWELTTGVYTLNITAYFNQSELSEGEHWIGSIDLDPYEIVIPLS